MNDNRVSSARTQHHHVFGESGFKPVIHHGISAIFDDDNLASELLDPRQGLGIDSGTLLGVEFRNMERLFNRVLVGLTIHDDLRTSLSCIGVIGIQG